MLESSEHTLGYGTLRSVYPEDPSSCRLTCIHTACYLIHD